MVHTVEVRHIGHNLAEATDEIRAWLERNRIEVAELEHSLGGPGIAFRLSFTGEAEAAAFADAFHGRFSRGDDSNGKPLWAVGIAETPPVEPS